jgi:hypothetical protein
MLFEFIDIGYSASILFFIIGTLIFKKQLHKYCHNCIAVSNHLLILYGWYLIFKLYQLVQFVLALNIKVNKTAKQPINIGWLEIKFILLILIPYLFLFKKLAKNRWISFAMLAILQWDIFVAIYQSFGSKFTSSSILFYLPYMVELKILNYSCLFIAVYALLWLFKKLPSQQLQ